MNEISTYSQLSGSPSRGELGQKSVPPSKSKPIPILTLVGVNRNTEFDTLWLATGNSNTNNSSLTKGTWHESLITSAEYGVYFTSIYAILRV